MRGSFFAGLITFALIALVSHLKATPYDNYVLLADAFLHGHIAIHWPGPWIDALPYKGNYYVIEAPFPAILLLPFVAVYGTAANETLLAAILAGVAVGTGWEILRRLNVSFTARVWLCGFLLLGTDLFWCATLGDVFFIAHVSAVAFTLLALLECQGKRRAWLIALCAVCAAESRFSMIVALPIYAALLATDPAIDLRRGKLLTFGATLLPFVLLWIGYNEARWHVPYDIGYTAWYQRGDPMSLDPKGTGSPFELRYLRYELYSFFIRLPTLATAYPYAIPTYNGIALTWTSPALILSFFARRPRRLVMALWAGALLAFLPNAIYYANGFNQFGMRHALDFEPFLFVLMGLAARERFSRIDAALCAWSVSVGAWGVWYWLTFYRP